MEEPVPAASLRRKNKGKAPLPPADTRSIESSSTLEFEAAIMDQKENLERDIQLTVVLPGEVTASASVNGSKPMMDLLIFLCAQYHLNPSAYTMELVSEGPGPVKFKPNTPVGMLEVDKVILKAKNVEDKHKKLAPVVPEQTVRVVINYKKTQKVVVRASPHVSLQELLPTISSKCELDPLHTVLLKDLHSQEPLEMSKSLNDLGLRELYAADTSRAASAAELHLSSSQESFQIPQNVDLPRPKEDEKGFFRFLRRSKKKRDQVSSAPATPLLADQRPVNTTRPSKVFKQYESNTLPSEMPKKRRAPLPPMYASQTVPKDFAQGGPHPQSCLGKSVSVDGDQQDISGKGVVRTNSLQLSGSSSNESTLRRGKRKAPPPPSPTSPPAQDRTEENSNETAKSSPARSISEEEHGDPPSVTAGAVFDYSLEGIEEKEEGSSFHKEAGEAMPVTVEPSIPTPSVDVESSSENDVAMSTSPGVSSSGSNRTEEEIPEDLTAETRVTNGTAVGTNTEDLLLEKNLALKTLEVNSHHGKLESQNSKNEHGECKSQAGSIEINSTHADEAVQSTDGNICEKKDGKSSTPHMANGKNHNNSACKTVVELVMVKKHDAAIQTASLNNEHSSKMDAEYSRFGVAEEIDNPHWTLPNRLPLQSPSLLQQHRDFASNSTSRSEATTIMKANQSTDASDGFGFVPTERTNQDSIHSPSKGYALYRQLSEPKPKASNEITRDYIPKVGMTTYKIVPPSSLEKLRFLEPEKWTDGKDMGHDTLTQHGELYRSQAETDSCSVATKADHRNYYSYSTDASVVSPSAHRASRIQTQANTIAINGPPMVLPKPDKVRIPLEKRESQCDLFPKTRTNSFYSQLQRRVTGQYVTSAAAKHVISPASPNANTSPTSIISPNIPTSPAARTSPTSLTTPASPTTHTSLTSITSPSARTSPTSLTTPASPTTRTSLTTITSPAARTSPTSLTSPASPTTHTHPTSITNPNIPTNIAVLSSPAASPSNLTSPENHANILSKTMASSSLALTSPKALSNPSIPVSLAALTRPTSLTSHTIPSSLVALTSPTALSSSTIFTRPTSFSSQIVPSSPATLASPTKPASPATLPRPTALASPISPASLNSPTAPIAPVSLTSLAIPIPVGPLESVTENNVPLLSPVNAVPSANGIPSSSELIHATNVINPGNKSEKLPMKPPLIAPKPFSTRSKTSGLLQLRSFAAPRPYSAVDAPSPFARAVSSAVKRSQSFSKAHGAPRHPLRGGSLNERSPSTSPGDFHPMSPDSYPRRSSDCTLEKKMNLTNFEKSSTVHCPPRVQDKKPPLCPSSDPEQIRQSLLDAIRSGEAAANLKRVAVRSNTILINGRSGWGRSISTDVP